MQFLTNLVNLCKGYRRLAARPKIDTTRVNIQQAEDALTQIFIEHARKEHRGSTGDLQKLIDLAG